jgi:hypothetical protein
MNIAGFNETRLAAQYKTFGEPAVIGGLSVTVCASGHRGQSTLADGGLDVAFARSVRCRKADLTVPPKLGATAVIGGRKYRIADVTVHDMAGEYVLGLEQQK